MFDTRMWWSDALIVVALFGGAVMAINLPDPNGITPPHTTAAVAAMLVGCVALIAARTHPRVAVAVTTTCVLVVGTLGYLLTPLLLAPAMVALYHLAARSIAGRTVWAFGSVAVTAVVAAAIGSNLDNTIVLRAVGPALWLMLPIVLGSRSRLHRDYVDAVHSRADHAERTREDEARLRVAEERMRIARDLHDVVAHHMAVANAQAGTAAHLLEAQPNGTKKMLYDLQQTTSTAMVELRTILGVLRSTHEPSNSVEPTPGLDLLPQLLDSVRSAGLDVDLVVRGTSRPLAPGVDLTAYRIIQEALTNATKHSTNRTAHLDLLYDEASLTINIANATNEPEVVDQAHGFGLMGMRERASAMGGWLQVSNTAGTRFDVVATLPLTGSRT